MIRLLSVPARARRFLIPGLTGLILGSLPGVKLILWSSGHTPAVIRSPDEPGRANALPASTAYRSRPSLWENPNG